MNYKRTFRREIFSEKKQFAFVFNAKNMSGQLCEVCVEESVKLPPEIIAEILPIGTREIYRQIEAGKVHFTEIDEKRVLVCMKSLRINAEKQILQIKLKEE